MLQRGEELELFNKYLQGDQSAGHRLVLGHLPLWKKIAGLCSTNYNLPYNDALSDALAAALRALDAYQPAQASFAYFAALRIRGALQYSGIKRAKEAYRFEREWDIDSLEGRYEDAEVVLCKHEQLCRLQHAIAALPERERLVLQARFSVEEPRLKDVGEQLNLSAEGVRLIEKRALEQLRGYIGGRDEEV